MVVKNMTGAGAQRITAQTIEATTSEQAKKIQTRMAEAQQQGQRLQEFASAFQEATVKGDTKRMDLITADFKAASEHAEEIRFDLASSMLALGTGFKDIGLTIDEIQKLNYQEEQIIADAKELVEQKKASLEAARLKKIQAEGKWFFRGSAVNTAQKSIDLAKLELATAEAGIETAKQLAAKMQRERLQNASLADSLQRLQTITTEVTEISEARIGEIEANLDSVKVGRVEIIKSLTTYATQVQEGDKKIVDLKAVIANLRMQQSEMIANSPEWTDLKGQVEAKNNELAEVEAERNKAFALHQDGLRFVEMYRVQENAQLASLQFHKTWVATLRSGVEQRATIFTSHLGVVQASADQQAMDMVDQIATKTDEDITADAVAHTAAQRDAMLKKLQRYPDQIATLRELGSQEAKSQAQFWDALAELARQFSPDNYGAQPGYDDPETYRKQPADSQA